MYGENGRWSQFHYFVGHASQRLERARVGSCQNHSNVMRKSLQEELSKDRNIQVFRLVSEQFVHSAEQLGWFSASQLDVRGCCNLRCSDAVVRRMSSLFKRSYGRSAGGARKMSRTRAVEASGSAATTVQHSTLRCYSPTAKGGFDVEEPQFTVPSSRNLAVLVFPPQTPVSRRCGFKGVVRMS